MIARLAARTGLPVPRGAEPLRGAGRRDGAVEASGALRTVAVSLIKIANDLRWLGSGPRGGLGEIAPARRCSRARSIMPGKVNPVIPEAVDAWSPRR